MAVLFVATSIAFLLALILTPMIRGAANRLGLVDKPDSVCRLHVGSVPRLVGILVALAYALAPAAALIVLVGLVDDIRGLQPWQELLVEAAAAGIAYASGFGVYVFRGQPVSNWISPPLAVVWLVGCTNALNLLDGMSR